MKRCGCEDKVVAGSSVAPGGQPSRVDAPRLRHVALPAPTVPRVGPAPGRLADAVVRRVGMAPTRAVVNADAVDDELLHRLDRQLEAPPPLRGSDGQGALDIRLQTAQAAHVKSGTVAAEGPRGVVALWLDPLTRRFRADGLAPGEYRLLAASAGAGRGELAIIVRAGDVTRGIVTLDGSPPEGETSISFRVPDGAPPTLRVVVQDRLRGAIVYDDTVAVRDGRVEVAGIPVGLFHVDVYDETGARSCYDTDPGDGRLSDLLGRLADRYVEMVPPIPGPEPDPFAVLADRYRSLGRILPELGVRSIRDLAAIEGEDLLHRALRAPELFSAPIDSPLFADVIGAARRHLGLAPASALERQRVWAGEGSQFARSFLPQHGGQAQFTVEFATGAPVELVLAHGDRVERHTLSGRASIEFDVDDALVEAGQPIRLTVTSPTGASVAGDLTAAMPFDVSVIGMLGRVRSTKQDIETILTALAVANPGLSTTVADWTLLAQNSRAWLDIARTHLTNAGVCSLSDLGTLRLDPAPVLKAGMYVAPARPPTIGQVPALDHYRFAGILGGSVLQYLPNDTLHDTAVVMAGEWDIRNQTIVIGKEVRELVIIVKSIRHNTGSRFTWEMPTLPGAASYWPNPAADGPNGDSPGQDGQRGEDGDPDPHPARNGGADALTPAPTVTMFVLDTTNNLPPIDLPGQNGGAGGVGQNGGRGGDGAQGHHADSGFFNCCREVGWGGDGGRGGNAGRGGQGGHGGQGGRVTVLTAAAGIAVMADQPPVVIVTAGAGGPGGPPGQPGVGGKAGPAGSADCELFCASHDNRHGSAGAAGAVIEPSVGRTGPTGPPTLSDAIQILPLTEAQWNEVFSNPHILQVSPTDVEPGGTVTITGQNFMPGTDRVFFDGVLQPESTAPVVSTTKATLVIPLDSLGGSHPIVIRPVGASTRRSNRVLVRVLPVIDPVPAGTRWIEGQATSITGLAFTPGCRLFAQDASASPPSLFELPVTTVTRTKLDIQLPPGPLGALRGVRRLIARNNDGGESRAERVVRIGDTIVVRCAAFRVVGTTPGIGTPRSAAEIAALFTEGATNALTVAWGAARVAFELVQPVGVVTTNDAEANIWPQDEDAVQRPHDTAFVNANGVPGVLNFFFCRQMETSTAYAWIGGGPLFIGENEGDKLGTTDFLQVVAHEIGHALCLPHVCPNSTEEAADTFFGRACQDGDNQFLMYPYWDASDSMQFAGAHDGLPSEVDSARTAATHVERGKKAKINRFAGIACGVADTAN